MIDARISILGMTEYNPEIWNKLVLPEEAEDHREDIIDEICMEASDLELLYPDWNVMQRAIGRWSRHMLPIFSKLYKAKALEYQPLWNVDEWRSEVRNIRDDGTHSKQLSGQNDLTGSKTGTEGESLAEDITKNREMESDGTETVSKTTSGSEHSVVDEDSTTTNKSNSFNAAQMIDNNQQVVDRGSTTDRTTSGTESGTTTDHTEGTEKETFDRDQSINRTSRDDSTEHGTHSENESGTTANIRKDEFEVNRHGNIGVTSSQQLLQEEWEVAQLDAERFIIDSFIHTFCLTVY